MSYIFNETDNKQIEDLSSLLKKIITLIPKNSEIERVLELLRSAESILESKDVSQMMQISSILYDAFNELDQTNLGDDLDFLMHEAYVKTVQNKIFKNDQSAKTRILDVNGEKRLLNFVNTDDGYWQQYEDKVDFLAFISPLDGLIFKPWNTEVKIVSLPFYTNVSLVEILHRLTDGSLYWRHFVKHKKGWLLDEKSGSLIDGIQKYEAPSVNLSNIMDYVKFYQFFTYSETGRGILIEGENSEFLQGLSGYYKSIYLEDFQAPTVKQLQTPLAFEISFRSVSGDGMSDVIYHIYPDGGLEFIDLKFIGAVKPFPY